MKHEDYARRYSELKKTYLWSKIRLDVEIWHIACQVQFSFPLSVLLERDDSHQVVEVLGKSFGKVVVGRPILELEKHGGAGAVNQPILDGLEPPPELDKGRLGDYLTGQAVDEVVLYVAKVTGEGLRVPQPLVDVLRRVGNQDGLATLPLLL